MDLMVFEERSGRQRSCFELEHKVFPLSCEGSQLRAEVFGEGGEALSFGGGGIGAELLFSVRECGFDAGGFLFKKRAPLLHLLLLDGIQAAFSGVVRAAFNDDGVG